MKKAGVSILNLTNLNGRLEWTVQKWYISDHDEKFVWSETDYHTNNAGDGLWRGDKQIVGTLDFMYSAKDPRRSFYRMFAVNDREKDEMEENERWHYLTPEQKEKELEEEKRFNLVEDIAYECNMIAEADEEATYKDIQRYKKELMQEKGVTEEEVKKWRWLFDGSW